MIVIGLTGYKGAGKDSVADILVEDYGFTKMAFAAPLKRMLKALDPIVGFDAGAYYCSCESCATEYTPVYLSEVYDEYNLTDQEIKDSDYGDEVRRLWERFGTEVMRAEDENYWVRKAWQSRDKSAERIVFTDVRFENEADFIREQRTWAGKSALWKIHRPGVTAGTHAAEQLAGLLGEQITIINDGPLDLLPGAVAEAWDLSIGDKIPGQMAFDLEGL